MYHSIFSFEYLFFFLRLFCLSNRFYIFWALDSWIFCLTFHLVQCFRIFDFFKFLYTVVTANKEKHKAWHGSHTLQITSWKPLVTQTFFDVSNENVLSLSHASWVTNHKTFIKKLLAFCPKALTRKRKRRRKKGKAFCVTYKRKKRKGVAKLVAL